MEGGGGVHSIKVHAHSSSRIFKFKETYCFVSFLRRIKGSQFTEPMSPQYGTASSVVTDDL